MRVSQRDSVEEMVRKGRDLEKVVLSRAVPGIWKIVSWCIRTRQSCSLRWTAPPKATTEKQIPPFARNDMSS